MSVEASTTIRDRWLRLDQWLSQHPGEYPDSMQTLRRMMRDRHKNGLVEAGVVRKVGKIILLNESRLPQWIDSKREAQAGSE